ncbi:MAG TPA: peptide chain release factor N(5)-glutamine methyltransferase [Burkholderiaceae bacterium]|nr:peptide chain release factor N(5)-glutamine methyltransferase [Burkholderiaceae bacterium]
MAATPQRELLAVDGREIAVTNPHKVLFPGPATRSWISCTTTSPSRLAPKTSGARGLHVYVRIQQRRTFDEVRRAALAFAREIERKAPRLATTEWWKEARHGVFVDYNENAKDRTIAAAYSVRPNAQARVSAPLAWDELDAAEPGDFTLATMPARFARVGDRHEGIDAHAASLEALLELSARQARDGLGDAPWPPLRSPPHRFRLSAPCAVFLAAAAARGVLSRCPWPAICNPHARPLHTFSDYARTMPSIAEVLKTSGLPVAEARALLAHVLAVPREGLIAHPDAHVEARAYFAFDELATRRRSGEPLAYLLGAKEFYGRSFAVSPAVLIPRPETELLIDLALAALRDMHAPRILDLGTGSGCIAITLALERRDATVCAVETSDDALALARANAQRLGAAVEFAIGPWYTAVTGRFHAIVSNPPYIAIGDPHLREGDLRFEPTAALIAGPDGLAALRAVIEGAPTYLEPGGVLLVEHGFDQGKSVRALFAAARLVEVRTERDAAGIERAAIGVKAV